MISSVTAAAAQYRDWLRAGSGNGPRGRVSPEGRVDEEEEEEEGGSGASAAPHILSAWLPRGPALSRGRLFAALGSGQAFVIGAGRAVGHSDLLDNAPSSASVVARTGCELARIPAAAFTQHLAPAVEERREVRSPPPPRSRWVCLNARELEAVGEFGYALRL